MAEVFTRSALAVHARPVRVREVEGGERVLFVPGMAGMVATRRVVHGVVL